MTAASSTKARVLKTINPATEEVINTYEIRTKEQINEKVKKAQNSFSDWKKDIQRRADHIHDFSQELRKNKEELARTVTKEMGKVIKEARSEVEKCAWVMDYFADNGKVFTTDEVVNTDARRSSLKLILRLVLIIRIFSSSNELVCSPLLFRLSKISKIN